MNKRVFLLNGLAIVAVVLNHATSWGITAMFWWTDRYRPVTVPNFDQIGSLTCWILFGVRKLTVFCVPAFLFVSGFFVGYTSRGSQPALNWKMVKTRILNLVVPYLVWSVLIFAVDALQGAVYTPMEYLVRLLATGAAGGYYFVPLLCQFYLLSPFLIPIAKDKGRQLLLVSALLQLGTMIARYVRFAGPTESAIPQVLERMAPHWFFPSWVFFFTLGIVCSFHLQELKQHLSRWKWSLSIAVIVLGVVAILESDAVFRVTKMDWLSSPLTIPSGLYSVAVILWYLTFEKVPVRLEKALHYLGGRTYGIYLLHAKAMELAARAIHYAAPWMLAYQLPFFQSIMLASGLGIPLFLMASIPKSRLRRSYRYLFG